MSGMRVVTLVLAPLLLVSTACAVQQQNAKEQQLTVGVVQKQIRAGMSQAEVAEALGSPNIVTRDSDGKEAWIYDKIGTEASYASSGGGGSILILSASHSTSVSQTTQRTLTVIIKFGADGRVESFTYHASKF
jgi:outer membrane protein assembly factor BamE (lipoprotein component of BamABCDE complex)